MFYQYLFWITLFQSPLNIIRPQGDMIKPDDVWLKFAKSDGLSKFWKIQIKQVDVPL